MGGAFECYASIFLYSHPPHAFQLFIYVCTNKVVWTGLESLGFGANLQHYNPLIDAPVAKQWDIPGEWRGIAQLVFGSAEGSPGEKTQKPVGERVRVYGRL